MNEKEEKEIEIPSFSNDEVTEPIQENKEVEKSNISDTQTTVVKNANDIQKTSVDHIDNAKEEDVKEMPNVQNSKKSKNIKTNSANSNGTAKPKRKVNYLVVASLVVLLIPCLVLLYIIIGSHENKGEPVIGDRFDEALDPAISTDEVSALQTAIQSDQADSIKVTLRSATLRITIDAKDDLSQEQIQSLMNTVYEATIGKFPVETYFTNKTIQDKTVKMYDLEVSAYNFIPENDEDKANQIHLSRTKNAAAESDVVDVLSSAKNAETSGEILNPDTSVIPGTEGNAEGE